MYSRYILEDGADLVFDLAVEEVKLPDGIAILYSATWDGVSDKLQSSTGTLPEDAPMIMGWPAN